MKSQIFSVPNLDKNVKIKEVENGLEMLYTLSCTKEFPLKTFFSKNKWYYQTSCFIPYGTNMSKRLNFAYNFLKTRNMLKLAEWKQLEISVKIADLKKKTLKYQKYVD